jgi:DDE superfamily endonuclease
LTVAFTINATGTDRWEPLYIGHAAKPRAFKGKTGQQHSYFYLHNQKAWMTGTFFELYLRKFNSYIGRTKMRKVLLLIDNAPSHIYKHLDLAFVEVYPLPPNTTSKLQPLDAGMISSFKRHYRQR